MSTSVLFLTEFLMLDEDIDDELFKAFREEPGEMSPDIAQINKLIKFLRGQNVAVINISLVSLLDVDFSIGVYHIRTF